MPKAPKPRLAIYGGAAVGIMRVENRGVATVANALAARKGARMQTLTNALQGVPKDPLGNAANVGIPAAAGVLLSVAADKLGVNRVLAKARMPFRV